MSLFFSGLIFGWLFAGARRGRSVCVAEHLATLKMLEQSARQTREALDHAQALGRANAELRAALARQTQQTTELLMCHSAMHRERRTLS